MSKHLNTEMQLDERRESRRVAVEIGATAFVANSDTALKCTILDISETGAKLELKGLDIIPSRLQLYVPDVDCTFTCEVAWRNDDQLGLKFVNSARF